MDLPKCSMGFQTRPKLLATHTACYVYVPVSCLSQPDILSTLFFTSLRQNNEVSCPQTGLDDGRVKHAQ